MITVEWFDYEKPGEKREQKLRRGKLLQVGRGKHAGDEHDVAYVIAPKEQHDRHYYSAGERGGNIILAVKLTNLVVLGVDIPLFDHAP